MISKYLLDTAILTFTTSKAVKEKVQINRLATYFNVAETEITDKFLTQKLIKTKEESQRQKTALELEKDFEKRLWFSANKAEVERFPDFTRSIFFSEKLPQKEKEKLPTGIWRTDDIQEFEYIRQEVRRESYLVCDFGRAQRIHEGTNRLSSNKIVGRREVNSGRYSSRCTYPKWDYYSDYTFVLHPDKSKFFYRLADGTEKIAAITKNGTCRINGKVVKRPQHQWKNKLRKKDILRALNNVLGKRTKLITVSWDETRKVPTLTYRNEEYHLSNSVNYKATSSIESAITEAINAIKRRLSEKIDLQELKNKASNVFVSYDDSRNSGNCHTVTVEFARKMWSKIGAVGECAVRGDLILSERNDNYTRRAIAMALQR